jgi:hypothetical protein
MAAAPLRSEQEIRQELNTILLVHTRSDKQAKRFYWITAALFALPFALISWETLRAHLIEILSLYVIGSLVLHMFVQAWAARLKRKGVQAFKARFPKGRPERTIAMQLLTGRAKDNNDTRNLFLALGGAASLVDLDDKPADVKIQEALARLGPPPASSPSSASKSAPPRLGHMPLQPEEHRSLEESNDEAWRR